MNHTQQIIQDAIEGGWQIPFTKDTFVLGEVHYSIQLDPFLDPLFWQSVGKTRAWKTMGEVDEWVIQAHGFFASVMLGDDIETALSNLN